jgi:hypothetical protein
MWCRFKNQRRDLGIGLMMRELEAHGMRGTFFTEVFGSQHFGLAGLREAVLEMHGRGHDVQLHTHPIQRRADWRTRKEEPAPDDIADYALGAQVELLREGIGILESCGLPKGSVTAFRAGNFGASNETWTAMAQAGLKLSSNYNPCYFQKNCKMRSDVSEPGLFDTGLGVWELPISNFQERGGGFRHVQITAVSVSEMQDYLRQARRLGIGEVTIVTHSFELCHIDDVVERRGRPNSVNLSRLRGLCRFLGRNERDFVVETVGALARRLPVRGARRGLGMPRGRPLLKARRLVEQAFKRVEARAPFSLSFA